MKWLKTCPKSASYICQRIFVAFGKVNNTQGGDHRIGKNNKSQPPPGLGKRSAFNISRPHLPRRLLAAMADNDGGALVNDYNVIIPHNESNVNAVKQTVSQLVGI